MTIANSNLAAEVIKETSTEVGKTYFFNHLAVVEFDEGTHIDLTAVNPTISAIKDYFGHSKPFGLIANRINSYSVSLLDIKDAREALPNLSSYGIIAYDAAGKMNSEIESTFCLSRDICFDNLYEGLNTVYQRVKQRINISLN